MGKAARHLSVNKHFLQASDMLGSNYMTKENMSESSSLRNSVLVLKEKMLTMSYSGVLRKVCEV